MAQSEDIRKLIRYVARLPIDKFGVSITTFCVISNSGVLVGVEIANFDLPTIS